MKFECKSNSLVSSINKVAKARSRQTSQSYLQDIYLELDNHLLTLRATNLEISCEKSISVKGIQNGKCIVKGDTLVKIAQLFQKEDEVVICEVIDGVFTIVRENGVVELKTTPYEDFPTLPKEGEEIGKINSQALILGIKDVSFCSATTEIKPEIASVFIYSKDNSLYFVATDSYRLAERVIENDVSLQISTLLPQKHISDIVSILQEEDTTITLYKNEGILTCVTETGLTLCIHTITGQFPDYKQLFPKSFTTTSVVKKDELQKALTLTTYFTENYSQVKCVFSNNSLTLHSRSESVGQVTNTIKTTQEGEDIESSYNNKYFLDVLPHIDGGDIVFSFTTGTRPMFMKGKDNTTFTYLLMPLTR